MFLPSLRVIIPPEQVPILYAHRILVLLDGMDDECIESTMKIVRALLEYRNSVKPSGASEERIPQFS
jgi:hypothetical protein